MSFPLTQVPQAKRQQDPKTWALSTRESKLYLVDGMTSASIGRTLDLGRKLELHIRQHSLI